MKLNKIFSCLAIFAFLIVFLPYCAPKAEMEEPQVFQGEQMEAKLVEVEKTPWDYFIEKMILDEGMDREQWMPAMVSLAERLEKKGEIFRKKFLSGEPLGELFGEAYSFVSFDYQQIQGEPNITEFWGEIGKKTLLKAKENNATPDVKFEIISIFLTDELGKKEIEIAGEKVTVDCVAIITFKIGVFLKTQKGEILVYVDPPGSGSERHRDGCDWIDGKTDGR